MKMKNVPFSENRAIYGGRASGRLEMGVRGAQPPAWTKLLAGDFVPTLFAKAGWRETRLCTWGISNLFTMKSHICSTMF